MRHPTLSTEWLFAPVCLIGIVHIVNGVSVLLAPEAAKVSALSGLFIGPSDPIFVAMLLIVAGVMAIVGRFCFVLSQDVRFALIIPQQLILMAQMVGIWVSVYTGTYPDGYSPSPDWYASAVFISSDQAALVVMCLSHTVELVVSRSIMGRLANWLAEIKRLERERDDAEQVIALMRNTHWWETIRWDEQGVPGVEGQPYGKIRRSVAECITITAPDGTVWSVGDKVIHRHLDSGESSAETEIAMIFPGNGSWDREQPYGDTEAVWFLFADGWMARPWLVEKCL